MPSPVYRAMRTGRLVRVEEITRMPSEVQDALVTVLSEKVLPVPELDTEVAAISGFNLIATANNRDRGINEMSSALRRRFNTVVLPLPATAAEEMSIVAQRVSELGAALALPRCRAGRTRSHSVVTIFRELREGRHHRRPNEPEGPDGHAVDGRGDLGDHERAGPGNALRHGNARAADLAAGIVGAVVRDPAQDDVAWREYLEGVVRDRDGWSDFYAACRELG